MTDPLIRPGNVGWLADAIRHAGNSVLADAVLANRFIDFTRAERVAALGVVFAELDAELVVSRARRRWLAGELRALGASVPDDDPGDDPRDVH
jgi:hypothetical protein